VNIAVLFDGAGLARLGLEMAGHTCTGYEIDPAKHYLSQMVGSGNCVLADVRDVDLSGFDAVWASPPCQKRSAANEHDLTQSKYDDLDNLLVWSLGIRERWSNIRTLWVENVIEDGGWNEWGTRFNAAQFLPAAIQNRPRVIGGSYKMPLVYRHYAPAYPSLNICPCIMASEYKGGANTTQPHKERRKAMRWYGRKLALAEMAYFQGLEIPHGLLKSWHYEPPFPKENGKPYTHIQWKQVISEAIGNGVPTYMAQAFGAAYTGKYPSAIRPGVLFEFEEAA
jgi:site-specific DNA-cytosine methylase